MTWALDFKPEKETVGTLTATWNAGQPDEFVFARSVNLSAAETLTDFRAVAEKFRQAQSKPPEYQAALDVLAAEMNK